MKSAFILSLLVVATLFIDGAIAQHEGHEIPQTAPAADKAPPCGMMADHARVTRLTDQLSSSFAAIENEKDPAALQTKLAAHGELLKQLHATVQGAANKMESMKGKMIKGPMMKGKMMGGSNKQ